MLDVQAVDLDVSNLALRKNDFPVFDNAPELIYLDSAATSQKPRCVIDAIASCYESSCAPVHRGLYDMAANASVLFESSRETVSRFINAASAQQCVFTRSATESINLVASGWARQRLEPADEVWVSEMEHHANYLPWQRVCQETGATLRTIKVSEDGELLVNEQQLFNSKVKLIALTHVSNVIGTINPISSIAEQARQYGIPVLIDACQSVGHMPVDVQALDCAFMAFSAHKMYGPEGIGVLYGKREYLEQCKPMLLGGGMVDRVASSASHPDGSKESQWSPLPAKLEAGSPNLSGAVGLAAAIGYVQSIGLTELQTHAANLALQAKAKLQVLDGVTVLGSNAQHLENEHARSGIVSFVVDGIHPHDIAQVAADRGVGIRAGHHCAQPLMESLGISSTSRASFGLYNTDADVQALVTAVKSAIKLFRV